MDTKNDMIMVIHSSGRSYVVVDPQPIETLQDTTFIKEYVAQSNVKWSKERCRALELAHNIDNALHTYFGVRETFVGSKKRRRGPNNDQDADDVTDTS